MEVHPEAKYLYADTMEADKPLQIWSFGNPVLLEFEVTQVCKAEKALLPKAPPADEGMMPNMEEWAEEVGGGMEEEETGVAGAVTAVPMRRWTSKIMGPRIDSKINNSSSRVDTSARQNLSQGLQVSKPQHYKIRWLIAGLKSAEGKNWRMHIILFGTKFAD